jgi:hypothetical protein
MGILSVQKTGGSWGMKLTDKFHRTYTETWQVITDSFLTGPLEVCLAPGLPVVRAIYNTGLEFDSFATVTDIAPQCADPDNNPCKWIVTVTYSSHDAADPAQENQDKADSPLSRPPDIDWANLTDTRACVIAENLETGENQQPQTSARQPFDPPPEEDCSHRRLTITRFESQFDQHFMDNFVDTLNKVTIAGYGIADGKIMSINGRTHYENKVRCVQVTYVIDFKRVNPNIKDAPARAGGWDDPIPDMGVVERQQEAIRRLRDAGGNALPNLPLDGGKLRAAAEALKAPKMRWYRKYPLMDWAPLRLPRGL